MGVVAPGGKKNEVTDIRLLQKVYWQKKVWICTEIAFLNRFHVPGSWVMLLTATCRLASCYKHTFIECGKTEYEKPRLTALYPSLRLLLQLSIHLNINSVVSISVPVYISMVQHFPTKPVRDMCRICFCRHVPKIAKNNY